MINKYPVLLLMLTLAASQITKAQSYITISSPDNTIKADVFIKNGQAYYSIKKEADLVLQQSNLGLIRADEDLSKKLSLISVSKNELVRDSYVLKNSKRLNHNYLANKKVIHLKNSAGNKIDVIFQVSDDGVAFRYYFPERDEKIKSITDEKTTFHFFKETKAWMQPMSVAKTGWESTNPSYEEYYQKEISVGTPAPTNAGWVYPALFKYKNTWLLISESGLDENYCATRLESKSENGNYKVGFPDKREAFTGQNVNPESKLPWFTPWRIIAIGNLKKITESTLGTDLAYPAKSNIKPELFNMGKASWSWIMLKDSLITYNTQKKYIDFAAEMKWEYTLIDVDWDTKIGYDKMQDLTNYAKQKNVGLLLWYNSAGDWNTVKYTPKNKLITHENRLKEFALLQKMGIKGIKVDFFGGDGQSMIKYYLELFEDAARFNLSVNCHGATLPRGWQRTYPNLMTMESIKGMEFITFKQENADEEPMHATTIPFTRNVFDPMDFTPMRLYEIDKINKKTTSAFELALPVIFQSGVQHLAEAPDGMVRMPSFIKSFLQEFPSSWSDTKLIDGYPGKFVVMARKAGSKWYIAGINGENKAKNINLNLSDFGGKTGTLIEDGNEKYSFKESNIQSKTNNQVTMKPFGGFVMVIE
ncbi:glycoside hydrolase family 97 catalytic domain-containing protein [Pedobacter lithocola]|uniref:Glycoside hydrolase family 97 catalytic domain-containing protein n=1 Tax=Pedobacter lithocola TaxID=1908239 RepID=A0ABV8P6J9_9SPHI